MEVLKIVYYCLLIASFVTLLLSYRRLPAYCGIFLPLIALGLLVQVTSDLLEANGINSYPLFHSYQPVECLLLLLFYYRILESRSRWLVVTAALVYLTVVVIHYVGSPISFASFDFFDFTTEAMIVCFFVIVFFLQLLKSHERTDLRHFTAFWLNGVHLIFYGGCLFVMGFYNYLRLSNPPLAKEVLKINHFLNLFLYCAYTFVFICSRTSKK